jgi:hypothetical protein
MPNGMTFAFWFFLESPGIGTLIEFNSGTGLYIEGQTMFWYSSTEQKPSKYAYYDPRKLSIAYIHTGQWIHIAMTFDQENGIIRWFRNGLEQYVESQMPFQKNEPIMFVGIGHETNTMKAYYDEVRIYDGALTHEDIYSLSYYNKNSHPLLSVPYPPRNIRAFNATYTTIDLTWDPPLYSTTEDLRNIIYTIVAVPANEHHAGIQTTKDFLLIESGISNLYYTMKMLYPSMMYTFRVFAENRVGKSLPSALSNPIRTQLQSIGGIDIRPTIQTGNGLLSPFPWIRNGIFSNNSNVYYKPNTINEVGTITNNRAKRLRC